MPAQTATPTLKRDTEHGVQGYGTQIPFDAINDTGCYVCNWSGHLLRIPEDSIKPGRSPVIGLVGPDQLFVTRISNDPFIPITKARMLAADCDVPVNF